MNQTFYFNTGVRVRLKSGSKLYGKQVWKGGTKQIPFTCENVPEGSIFMFACDNENLPEASIEGIIVRKILDSGSGGLLSKFAYFRLPYKRK